MSICGIHDEITKRKLRAKCPQGGRGTSVTFLRHLPENKEHFSGTCPGTKGRKVNGQLIKITVMKDMKLHQFVTVLMTDKKSTVENS